MPPARCAPGLRLDGMSRDGATPRTAALYSSAHLAQSAAAVPAAYFQRRVQCAQKRSWQSWEPHFGILPELEHSAACLCAVILLLGASAMVPDVEPLLRVPREGVVRVLPRAAHFGLRGVLEERLVAVQARLHQQVPRARDEAVGGVQDRVHVRHRVAAPRLLHHLLLHVRPSDALHHIANAAPGAQARLAEQHQVAVDAVPGLIAPQVGLARGQQVEV
mmetsp:Transcript_13863/g.34869  ORF Transcript_13863/g.34869 Transcript_13863/m.34869 type:complete len:219 (-) Transcript_13863:1517-2173(-)